MNLEQQGKNKCNAEMMSTVSSYKSKFELKTDLTNNTYDRLEKYLSFVFQTEK
jgi:hypothetical protein